MNNNTLRIGTRKSRLAMVQTEIVREEILAHFPFLEVEIVPMSTKGDQILDRSLTSFGGKGVFTKELEEALLRGEIDLAVHSAKDMPMEFPKGLALGAVLSREDASDVLVTTDGTPVRNMAPGSIIGTSSLRRQIQIRQMKTTTFVKPISAELELLIEKAIEYSKKRYGDTVYIFVDEKNSKRPMQYNTVQNKVMDLIQKKDLRDDHGELFGFGTHMFRHVYGIRLTELHLDDWTIAKLLGHTSVKNVKFYRKMSLQIIADETRSHLIIFITGTDDSGESGRMGERI